MGHDMRSFNREDKCSYHYVYKGTEGGRPMYYHMSWAAITYDDNNCTVFIVHDETAMIEIARKKEEENYSKRFVASLTHDLRTPLNGIMGIVESLQELVPEEGKHLLTLATNTGTLMLYLINDVLDMAQIEAKTLSLKKAMHSPRDSVDETIQLMCFNYKQKGLFLLAHFAQNLPPEINSDKVRYRQILLNVLGNALKFTSKGGVTVDVFYDLHSDTLITRCTDTGPGIAKGDFSKLFQLFGKISNTEKINPTGVGLGLHMCKCLSMMLEGNIYVESELGKGASFIFYVACGLVKPEVAAPDDDYIRRVLEAETHEGSKNEDVCTIQVETATDSQQRRKAGDEVDMSRNEKNNLQFRGETDASCDCPKILVVDDEPINIMVLKGYLAKTKLKLDVAYNGKEAIDMVLERSTGTCCKRYKAIFMDINMPIMNGVEATTTLARMAHDSAIPPTPVIALSAGRTDESEYGKLFQDILGKPISKATFLEYVDRYCSM